MKRLFLFAALLLASTAGAQTFAPIRVRCGAVSGYTDAAGNAWTTDGGGDTGALFTGSNGHIENWGAPIAGSPDAALFESQRWGNMVYTFPVPNGSYTVKLYFAEDWSGTTKAGQRVFNVAVNGAAALANFDVFGKAGFATADIETIPVTVTGGTLAVTFTGIRDNPIINAIEIVSAAPPPPLKIAFPGGGGQAGFTATFPIANAKQVPSCTTADGACSLQIQITLPDGTVVTGSSGAVAIVKTTSAQTLTVPIVTVTAGP